jgi:hypothetical protein
MPADGPSKEQLEYYFKNSRAYFDELAKQFYETDREYYNKYIAPFYSGPFSGAPLAGSTSQRKPAFFVVVGALFTLLIGGLVLFINLEQFDDSGNEQKKQVEDTQEKARSKPDERFRSPDSKTETESSNYEKGLKFFKQKNYDSAERYFNRVTKDDDNYDDAQNKLEEIKKLREENSTGNEKERNRRVQPIEKIR